MSIKFLVLGGGYFGFGGGGGSRRFYFYGRGDFSETKNRGLVGGSIEIFNLA